jgi:hypothetical protein
MNSSFQKKRDVYVSDSDSDISDSDTPPPKKHDTKKKSSKLKDSGEKKVDEPEGNDSVEQKQKKLRFRILISQRACTVADPSPSWFQKKSKGFASAAAGSRVGKGILKDFLDADSNRLLKALKVLITKDVSKARAKEVERDIIKSAVKVIYLYQEKRVTEDSFNGLTFSFRRICSAVRNAYQARNLDKATAERIEGMCINFAFVSPSVDS